MSIWDLSGAELSREIDQPAPITVLRGGHAAPNLAGVLAQIAALPGKDQAELIRAFQAALKPEPKRIGGGNTFKGASDFYPAFNAARESTRAAHGPYWYLNGEASLKARVPAAWLAIKGEMAVYRSPRDVNFPVAKYWPNGELPVGPEYAPHGPLAKGDAHEWKMARHRKALAFDLEPTPEDIDDERDAA